MATHSKPGTTAENLPLCLQVRYLGSEPSKGLWGIKHTRKPVDALVAAAKNSPENSLPLVMVEVSKEGIKFSPLEKSKRYIKENFCTNFTVDSISYGVQDLVYTRIFSMIVVKNDNLKSGVVPFDCHAFACESRNQARELTFALAAAFQEYGKRVKDKSKDSTAKQKFAIDLRTPEELEQTSDNETEA